MSETVLVFPKGTVVKFDGIPCLLLQDTPYESEHFRQNRNKNRSVNTDIDHSANAEYRLFLLKQQIQELADNWRSRARPGQYYIKPGHQAMNECATELCALLNEDGNNE